MHATVHFTLKDLVHDSWRSLLTILSLAVDGQYLVKYTLILQTSDPNSKNVFHEEASINLTQINQPVDIAFPAECLKISPTPIP